jgi:hypothetical protein
MEKSAYYKNQAEHLSMFQKMGVPAHRLAVMRARRRLGKAGSNVCF